MGRGWRGACRLTASAMCGWGSYKKTKKKQYNIGTRMEIRPEYWNQNGDQVIIPEYWNQNEDHVVPNIGTSIGTSILG